MVSTNALRATDWDDYRFFLAVAQQGSLSAAARTLSVSQPTVGRRIESLEEKLGFRLFERVPTGYRVSESGSKILDRAMQIHDEFVALHRQLNSVDQAISGRVRIATAEGLGVNWLASKLPQLAECYPGLEIELAIDMSMADLLRGEADIALRVGTSGCDELIGRRIDSVCSGLYASDAYLARYGEPKTPRCLRAHTIIESSGTIAHLQQVKLLREMAVGARVSCCANSISAQLAAARAGMGLLAIPGYMVSPADGLRRVLTEHFDVKLDLWLLTHQDFRNTPRIRTIMDFIKTQVESDSARLNAENAETCLSASA